MYYSIRKDINVVWWSISEVKEYMKQNGITSLSIYRVSSGRYYGLYQNRAGKIVRVD